MVDIIHAGSSGTRHLFYVRADGDRPVLEIYVDECAEGAMSPIRVNGVGRPLDDAQLTKGLTHTVINITEQGATPIICVGCMARYVGPRVVTLMARVYVPREPAINIDDSILAE